jgi:hypothetical protein
MAWRWNLTQIARGEENEGGGCAATAPLRCHESKKKKKTEVGDKFPIAGQQQT